MLNKVYKNYIFHNIRYLVYKSIIGIIKILNIINKLKYKILIILKHKIKTNIKLKIILKQCEINARYDILK